MAALTRFLFKFQPTCRAVCRSFSTNSQPSSKHGFIVSYKDQEKILNIFNENTDKLLMLKVPHARIQNIETYKSQHGPFTCLEDMLDVKGVTAKQLSNIFSRIVSDPKSNSIKLPAGTDKELKDILKPPVLLKGIGIKTAVGVHTSSAGVSWAKFSIADNKLQAWGYEHFEDLPKKMFTIDIFNLTRHILTRLPIGDVYVLEEASFAIKRGSAGVNYMEHTELNSMLMALINTSTKHNPTFKDNDQNVVYFMKPKLPARLFNTLIGQEKVSTDQTISQFLGNTTEFTLPCDPININKQFCDDYITQDSMYKELLGEALLLVVAFHEVCIKKKHIDSLKMKLKSKIKC